MEALHSGRPRNEYSADFLGEPRIPADIKLRGSVDGKGGYDMVSNPTRYNTI